MAALIKCPMNELSVNRLFDDFAVGLPNLFLNVTVMKQAIL